MFLFQNQASHGGRARRDSAVARSKPSPSRRLQSRRGPCIVRMQGTTLEVVVSNFAKNHKLIGEPRGPGQVAPPSASSSDGTARLQPSGGRYRAWYPFAGSAFDKVESNEAVHMSNAAPGNDG